MEIYFFDKNDEPVLIFDENNMKEGFVKADNIEIEISKYSFKFEKKNIDYEDLEKLENLSDDDLLKLEFFFSEYPFESLGFALTQLDSIDLYKMTKEELAKEQVKQDEQLKEKWYEFLDYKKIAEKLYDDYIEFNNNTFYMS